MSNTIYTPYTYLIGWSKLNKYYYGVRYAKNCHPNELMETYFTSSKNIPILRESFGEPDIIQIRKTFETREQAIEWETKVLKRIKAAEKEYFINETNGNLNWYNEGGYKCSKNHIDNMKNSRWSEEKRKQQSLLTTKQNKQVWAKRTDEERKIIGEKISLSNKSRETWNKGITHTDKVKKKISENTKKAMSSSALRSHLSKKAKERCDENFSKRISETNKRRVSCIHCKREFGLSSLSRHQNGKRCKN